MYRLHVLEFRYIIESEATCVSEKRCFSFFLLSGKFLIPIYFRTDNKAVHHVSYMIVNLLINCLPICY